jgi:hypothetical protein
MNYMKYANKSIIIFPLGHISFKGSLHICHQGCDFGQLTLEGREGGRRVCLVTIQTAADSPDIASDSLTVDGVLTFLFGGGAREDVLV